MLFDIALAAVCIAATVALWHRISLKIPELVAIPDEVIIGRLHEDSAKIRVFLLSIRRHWQEGNFRQFFLRRAEKALCRAHIFILRTDNGTMALLKKVRTVLGETNGNGAVSVSASAKTTQDASEQERVASSATPVITIRAHSRIQEVRRRRTPRQDAYIQQRLPE